MKFQTTVRRILINAAKLIERGQQSHACLAINDAVYKLGITFYGPERTAARTYFSALFSPYKHATGEDRTSYRGRRPFGSATFWDQDPPVNNPEVAAQLKRDRVNALLHAAASFEGERADYDPVF